MVVQHNLRAMNSNRMLGLTSSSQSKSTEKLSSGYKINRAADDAAGLAISEKMRKQIRGLTQASLNAQDGISAVQTAEGALTEVHDMIQRMNELAVKAANGTNSQEERDYIQAEVDQLTTEINRVAETTKFNDLYLLKGDPNGVETATVKREVPAVEGTKGTAAEIKYKGSTKPTLAVASGTDFDDLDTNGLKLYEGNGAQVTSANVLDLVELKDDGTVKLKDNVQLFTVATNDPGAQVYTKAATAAQIKAITDAIEVKKSGLFSDTSGAADKFIEEEDLGTYIDDYGNFKKSVYNADGAEVALEDLDDYLNITKKVDATEGTPKTTVDQSVSAMTLNLHVGAESSSTNKISVQIMKMDANTLFGSAGVDVKTEASATATIDKLNAGLRIVSEQRAKLGAVQNRLEHTINNLDNVVENTTAAESQIRDTDMATEMVKYSNNNILAQAGQAMLAQSNQANQGVLSLLQ